MHAREDGYSDIFHSVWWPAFRATPPRFRPTRSRKQVERQSVGTVWDDLNIWRHQEYVEHPALSKVDAKPYMALREWVRQFDEVPASV